MNRRYFVNWSIWIGVWSGIYVFLYSLSPLNQYGVVPATFVALPIYFLSGAKKEEFVDFASSEIIGVIWGLFYLFCINKLLEARVPFAITQGIVVGGLTIVLCAIHFAMFKRVFTKIPMMFGAISFIFITNGEHPIATIITLFLGLCLAYLCNFGASFLNHEGKWQFKASKEEQA